MDLEKVKVGGAGGTAAIIIYFLATMNASLIDLNKAVADYDSRLDVIEYRLDAEKGYVRQSTKQL